MIHDEQGSLFNVSGAIRPLADRMRPSRLEDYCGHEEFLNADRVIGIALHTGKLPSLVFWGPPGCGKTTLALMLAHQMGFPFVSLSAVTASIKEVKDIMEKARVECNRMGKPTLLFIDEIHRFNRAQQDAFLPFVEGGQIVLIGATTENPSFQLNSALLSRMQVVAMKPLEFTDLQKIVKRALASDSMIHAFESQIPDDVVSAIALQAQGDARQALNRLDALCLALKASQSQEVVSVERMNAILQKVMPRYDRDRENHYDFISALHKSLRNSEVQASLYWLARMIEGGEDPLFIARRLIRFASEDVGLAEPECLSAAIAAKEACAFIGLPECKLALAQVVVMLAVAPKSHALYAAYKKLEQDLGEGKNFEVPFHIRNAPTKLMKDIGYGHGYEYAHDRDEKTSSMSCLPDMLRSRVYYQPGELGHEKIIRQRMEYWNGLKQKLGETRSSRGSEIASVDDSEKQEGHESP